MTEQDFKDQYIVIFLATHTAMRYNENCQMDRHEEIKKHAIIEDAIFLADYAWRAYLKKEGL